MSQENVEVFLKGADAICRRDEGAIPEMVHPEMVRVGSAILGALRGIPKARPAGFEPATSRSGGERSIH